MRVLIEAVAVDFGGIRTYVENLVPAWVETFPDDEVHVVVTDRSDIETGGAIRHEIHVSRPDLLSRPIVQSTRVRRLARELAVDAVLATLPGTSILGHAAPTVVVVHDLRHELRTDQFSRARRLARGISYQRAYVVADGFVAVSQRTLQDLHHLHPGLRSRSSVVVHHGADHVTTWPRATNGDSAVTFAHHSNKNPDLVLDAWAHAVRLGIDMPKMIVLGTGRDRGRLTKRASALGLDQTFSIAPYLSAPEFTRVMADSGLIVFPSDFEGFGIPVLEAMALGKPVVVGPDPAVLEIAGGHASVMKSWSPEHLVAAVREAMAFGPEALAVAQEHAATFTWARAASQTRDFLDGFLTH